MTNPVQAVGSAVSNATRGIDIGHLVTDPWNIGVSSAISRATTLPASLFPQAPQQQAPAPPIIPPPQAFPQVTQPVTQPVTQSVPSSSARGTQQSFLAGASAAQLPSGFQQTTSSGGKSLLGQ